MTRELQSTLEASGIEWPALRNHIPWLVHVIQLALGAFMSSLSVKGRTKSWESHERDQQFRQNESIDVGKSQRLRKEGNATINKVSAMRPGLAKIIEIVRISWYFESPEADLDIVENACCNNNANTWSPKRVYWLSKSQSPHCSTSDYRCEDTLELYTGVALVRLLFTGIHMRVDSKPKIQWILAATHNSGWMDDCQVCHGSIEAISILDPLDVEEAYSLIASRYHSIQWHVWSHRWHDATFGQEEDSMERRVVLCGEVSTTESFQILCRSDSNDGHASYFRTHPRSSRKLRSFRKWDNGMDIDPENKTSYTRQYQEAFLNYVENEYCAKHWHVPVKKLDTVPSNNLVPSAMASGSYQSSFDPYDLSSDDEECLMHNNVAKTTHGWSDRVARLLTAARLYLNSPPEAAKNWGQINPNLNDYHSDPMEISSTFWILGITDWWRQQEETNSKYTDLSNVARNIFSIIPHGVGVEASFSLGPDVIG